MPRHRDDQPATVHELFTRAARGRPGHPALVDESAYHAGRTRTYAELDDDSARVAAGLHAAGLRRGDAIAFLLPTCTEWVIAFLAAARLGLLVVPLNTRYRGAELHHLLRTSQAKALVVAPEFESVELAARLTEAWRHSGDLALRLLVPVHAQDVPGAPAHLERVPFARLSERGAHPPAETGEPDDALIVFGTSGTTSAPKLAIHTQRTVSRHVPAAADAAALDDTAVALSVLPLNGTFGFVPFLAGLTRGVTQTLLPVYRTGRVLDALRRHGITFLACAEGPLRDLLADARLTAAAPALRHVVTAGVAIDDIVRDAAAAGITATNVYGSSEIFAFAATWPVSADAAQRAVPGGRPTAPGLRVRVSDVDTGAVLGPGAEGELQFSGSTLFTGYLADAEATARAHTADGWYRTGDRGSLLPGGGFRYHSRLGDAMRLKGYLVNPADVETHLTGHPAVHLAQLVGVRDDRTGDDQPVAFVTLRPGRTTTEAELRDHCRAGLAGFKVPYRIHILDEFPTTPSANGDKIRKDLLRDTAARLLTGA
ncbi:AMP-binding protein [Amycolatopsis endophytica]|uniref:Long-chain-fatty-acid--CoA ligase n=1 Tax=Amycolatopsis endophytica TaxID=860233 RepID=A0A853BCI3_9PSEU|nr:AMP-binding protein [Amycolatopsis endophytica]NYI92377.1 fatty-acyl-CoA synthase [Amycolatopsis endophytica]